MAKIFSPASTKVTDLVYFHIEKYVKIVLSIRFFIRVIFPDVH